MLHTRKAADHSFNSFSWPSFNIHPEIAVMHLKVFESTISSQPLMLLTRPIPNPESICLDSMAITNFAMTSDPPTPFEIKKRTPGWNDTGKWRDIMVIHCVYTHKRIGVRLSHQWWAGRKEREGRERWLRSDIVCQQEFFYPRSPQLAKVWIEKAEDWVQLQTESTWRPLHLDQWTNSDFGASGYLS